MHDATYTYDGKFEGNILIDGSTGWGKTKFVQNLGKLFGDIKEVYWISKIELSRDREEHIRDCFIDQVVSFDYTNNVDEFNGLLEAYRRKIWLYWEWFGGNMILDKLIVMDVVSRLSDKSFCKSMDSLVHTFFTPYTLQDRIGRWQCHRQKCLIFFPGLFMLIL